MTIEQLKQRYFWLQANDSTTKTEPQPQTFDHSFITPLIDMQAYMAELIPKIKQLGSTGDFIYIAGWLFSWLGGKFIPEGTLSPSQPTVPEKWKFDIDPGPDTELFIDLLTEKAKTGVDVRVLGWVSYATMGSQPYDLIILGPLFINWWLRSDVQKKSPYASLNAFTMNSVKELRKRALKEKANLQAMLNMLSHPVGSVHAKMVVLGSKTDATAFTGGLDLSQWRWAEYGHAECPKPGWPGIIESLKWHDVQAMVKGKAVQAVYDFFRDMWNENLKREPQEFRFEGQSLPSYDKSIKEVPQRALTLALPAGPQHHVQSLRTIPAFKFRWYNCLPEGKAPSITPQPWEGLFELRAAWKKAILGAQKYIYIEDNSLMCQEVLLWINEAVHNNPGLKVILLKGGGVDPADKAVANEKDQVLLNYTITEGLLKGLNEDQIDKQIRIFQAWGETVNLLPQEGLPEAHETTVVTGWIWGKDLSEIVKNLIGPSIFAGKEKKSLAEDALKERAQLRIGQKSYPVLGNLFTDPGFAIALKINNEAGGVKAGDIASLYITYGIYVHAKTTIIDDNWAMIGSNNVWRRSLYTDWEHAVAFLDESGEAVKTYRQKLWAEHFMVGTAHQPASIAEFADLQAALGAWSPVWATPGVNSPGMPQRDPNDPAPPYLKKINLPLPVLNKTPKVIELTKKIMDGLDETYDPDSRQPWGGIGAPKTI